MAISGNTVFEIRLDGDDNNSGGFVSGATGTDWSQQPSAKVTSTAGACNDHATFEFTASDGKFYTNKAEGNILRTTGSGAGGHPIPGLYEITSVIDESKVRLDRDPTDGENESSIPFRYGGALASLGGLGAAFQSMGGGVDGIRVYVRGGDYRYLLTTTTVNVPGGPLEIPATPMNGKSLLLKGYDPNYGRDSYNGARPIIDANGRTAQALIRLNGTTIQQQLGAFLEAECGASAQHAFRYYGVTYATYYDWIARGAAQRGFLDCTAVRCLATGCAVGYRSSRTIFCRAVGCSIGFDIVSIAATGCIASYNQQYGFSDLSNVPLMGCFSYGNNAAGFRDLQGCTCIGCVSYGDGGYAFQTKRNTVLIGCASDGAARGHTEEQPWIEIDSVSDLAADPFVDAENGDPGLRRVRRPRRWSHSSAGGGGTPTRLVCRWRCDHASAAEEKEYWRPVE